MLARGRLALLVVSIWTSMIWTSWSVVSAQTDPTQAPAPAPSRAAALTPPPPPVVSEPAPAAAPQDPATAPATSVVSPAVSEAPPPVVAAPAPPVPAAAVPAAATPAPVTTSAPPASASLATAPGPTQVAVDSAPVVKKSKEPMKVFGIGLKLGVAKVGAGDVKNPTYVPQIAALPPAQLAVYGLNGSGCDVIDRRCKTPSRTGFNLALPMQIGGSGVGFRVEPFLTLASNAKSYGVYTGPTFEFRVADPLYLGFGLGVKAAYIKLDPWKYAGDVYGRIPLSVTWYVLDDLALLIEFGFGAGASAYFRELRNIAIPAVGTMPARTIKKRADVAFGFARTWDLSVGFRFP